MGAEERKGRTRKETSHREIEEDEGRNAHQKWDHRLQWEIALL